MKAFEGPIHRYHWSGGKLAPAAPYALPPDLTILGFGLWDINKDGALEVIEVGKDDRLRVFSKSGQEVFSSSEAYGAPVHKFFSQAKAERGDDQSDPPDIPIRSRVLVEDVDRDGVDEVLVIRNQYAVRHCAGPGGFEWADCEPGMGRRRIVRNLALQEVEQRNRGFRLRRRRQRRFP